MTAKRPASERQKHHDAMLKDALSRPGVAEYMEVHQACQKYDRGLDSYREAVKNLLHPTATNRTNTSDWAR